MSDEVKNAFEEAAELREAMRKMTEPKMKQGFASMDPKRVKEISSAGGNAAAKSHLKHRFTSETAKIAGLKGLKSRGYKV